MCQITKNDKLQLDPIAYVGTFEENVVRRVVLDRTRRERRARPRRRVTAARASIAVCLGRGGKMRCVRLFSAGKVRTRIRIIRIRFRGFAVDKLRARGMLTARIRARRFVRKRAHNSNHSSLLSMINLPPAEAFDKGPRKKRNEGPGSCTSFKKDASRRC